MWYKDYQIIFKKKNKLFFIHIIYLITQLTFMNELKHHLNQP